VPPNTSQPLADLIAALVAVIGLGSTVARQPATPMAYIPAGPVLIGSDDGPTDERPGHQVELAEFWIDTFPVTTTQFAEFLNAVGFVSANGARLFDIDDSDARILLTGGSFVPVAGYEAHPAVEPTWYGARDYCTWRGARLPTEAEWERAARGANGSTYPWGEAVPTNRRAHFGARYGDYLAIGSFPDGASPDGVHDLSGNVWQWVSSLYWPYPYRADDGREDLDALGERGARGGGHDSPASHLRGAYRGRGLSRSPTAGHHNIGFRCASSVGPA
jgi:formylglycine-generating enzyme required for sulfatase activity